MNKYCDRRGREISFGEQGSGGQYKSDWNRGTNVQLFVTEGQTYVVRVYQWTSWQGESNTSRGFSSPDPKEILNWLMRDAGGKLGRASKEAWEEACHECEALRGFDVVEVD